MTNPNLDLVRSIYEKWAVGDFTDASWAAPDIDFVQGWGLGHPGARRGRDVMAREWRRWLGAWKYFNVVPHAWAELDDGVLVIAHFGGRSRTGGVGAAGFEGASRFAIRDGVVVELQLYTAAAEALDDLGLDRSQLTSWF